MSDEIECRLCSSWSVRSKFRDEKIGVFECLECGALFRAKGLPESFEEYYGEDYYRNKWPGSLGRFFEDFDPEEHHKTKFFDRQLGEFERLLKGKGRLLDVGCANGVFPWIASQRGWQAEGVEVSPFAAQWGRKQFGVTIHQGKIEDLPAGESYDLITLWDVLEHLPDPAGVLSECNERLKPEGILAILTPDSESLVNRLVNLAHSFTPERTEGLMAKLYHDDHLSYFTRGSLARALFEAGFYIHWIQGYDEAPADTETSGPTLMAVHAVRFSAMLVRMEHEMLIWARKPRDKGWPGGGQ